MRELAQRGFRLLAVLLGTAWPCPAAPLPDVVLLLTDQQRADAFGAAGGRGFQTPAMDRLAREGVLFTRAFCAAPQCSPARAALLTGRHAHRTGVTGNVEDRAGAGGRRVPAGMSPPLDPKVPGLAGAFAAAGYETAYFGKWHLGGDPGPHGFAVNGVGGKGSDEETTRRAVQFLEARRGGAGRRPFLLVVSWINPHDIYDILAAGGADPPAAGDVQPPESLTDDLLSKPLPQRLFLEEDQGKPFRGWPSERWRSYAVRYRDLVAKVDGEIGKVLGAIAPDMRRRTIVVLTSDHGDLGGAHGLPFKCPAMYEELVRVPFIVAWPGAIEPRSCGALASHVDLLPTLCDLAGVAPPRDLDGRSIRAVLEGRGDDGAAIREAVFAEYHGKQEWRVPIRMVRTERWKYVRYLRHGEELYDLERDPHELKNLARAPEHEAVRKELASRLDRWITETADPFPRLTATDRSGRELAP